MYHIRRGLHRQFPRNVRRLSMQGAEQRASEVGGGFMKWFKKYAIILVPGTFGTILSIDVVSNVNHRNLVEKIAPSYIDFLRHQVGFKDENLEEKRHAEMLEKFYSNDFRVRLNLGNGVTKEVTVGGRQSIESVIRELNDSTSSTVKQLDIYASEMVDVEDGSVEAYPSTPNELAPTLEKMLGNSAENESSDSVDSSTGFMNSMWTLHLSDDYRQLLNGRYRFYENLVFRPYVCIQNYLNMGVPGLFPFSYGQTQTRRISNDKSQASQARKESTFSIFGVSSSDSTSNNAQNGDADRMRAKQQVEFLEFEIKQLEDQKRLGYRDMDSVNAEIQLKRQEIQRLKRQYSSGFSLFW